MGRASPNQTLTRCQIVSVGKRRDGGRRYWCLEHKADATAKYGKKSKSCRYAGVPPIQPSEAVAVNPHEFQGGVAIWGAVPPVYDTTRLPIDRGIHVHARRTAKGMKVLDRTFRRVEIQCGGETHAVSELDAIYFMVSSVFGLPLRSIACTRCGYPHLDKDWFSVHPHKTHLCAGCGRTFRDTAIAVGNPVARLRQMECAKATKPRRARKKIRISQADYPGGIRVWGSNPAILWTSERRQESGIHVHAHKDVGGPRAIDDTYAEVFLDGIRLDERQVRLRMAQAALPHMADRIKSVRCEACGDEAFDDGADACTPRVDRSCGRCGRALRIRGRLRKVVTNPMVGIIKQLAESAPRAPETHDLGLLPETL